MKYRQSLRSIILLPVFLVMHTITLSRLKFCKFQEFLEPDELEDTLNEETISSNLMKFKSNRDSAESEVN